jgi:hypothetical protein
MHRQPGWKCLGASGVDSCNTNVLYRCFLSELPTTDRQGDGFSRAEAPSAGYLCPDQVVDWLSAPPRLGRNPFSIPSQSFPSLRGFFSPSSVDA